MQELKPGGVVVRQPGNIVHTVKELHVEPETFGVSVAVYQGSRGQAPDYNDDAGIVIKWEALDDMIAALQAMRDLRPPASAS